MDKHEYKALCDELDSARTALYNSHMVIAKIIDRLRYCVLDCEEALEEGVTDGSEQVYEGRQELAESLLEMIGEIVE